MGKGNGELAKVCFVSNCIYVSTSDKSLSQRKRFRNFFVFEIPHIPGSPRLKEVKSAARVFPLVCGEPRQKTHYLSPKAIHIF